MSIIQFPGAEAFADDTAVELYQAEHPEILHRPTDSFQSLPVTACLSAWHDGSVTLGEYLLSRDQAVSLIASLQAAVGYATPTTLADGSDHYRCSPSAEVS